MRRHLDVELELLDGCLVKGTPRPVEPEDALYGDTGAPAVIYFDDSAVQLTDVRYATLCRPLI